MVDDDRSKATPGSHSWVRKFTLSCSRCRAAKLKCDRKEPCVECVKRDLGHLCTKDERHPRAKRSKTVHRGKTASKHGLPANGDSELEAEETAQLLEHFVEGIPCSSSVAATPMSVAPDFLNRYWSATDPKRHGEKLALIREMVDVLPEWEVIHVLFEVFVTRCQGPLGNVVHTPTFMAQAALFGNCFNLASADERASAIASAITMETLGCYLLALVLGLAFHPTPSILGWNPTPSALRVEELRSSRLRVKTWRTLGLRCLQDGVSLFCGSIAGLQAAVMLLLDSQEDSLALDAVLVTAISGARRLGLHRLRDIKLDASALCSAPLENHTTGPAEPPHIRTEIGIRIWWALVQRDWSRGQALGYYTIQPSQFNTRMPLHVNDDDLSLSTLRLNINGLIAERPRSEFTMMSYTLHALEITGIVRESIELWDSPTREPDMTIRSTRLRKHLNHQYEKYVAGLPAYFRLGSTVGLSATGSPMAAIPVQRWMLHQQLWSLLLRLHRPSISSSIGRTFCQLLAQNIIGTQGQIHARCTVCGSLSTSEMQLFNAAVVLILDLIFTSRSDDNVNSASAQLLSRLMTRDKIREAMELLRAENAKNGPSTLHDPHRESEAEGPAQRCVVALEALMELEEEDSYDQDDSSAAGSTRGEQLAGTNLKRLRVAGILKALSRKGPDPANAPGNAHPQPPFEPSSPFNPLLSFANGGVTDGFPDLDMLPVLSNSLVSPDDLWQWQFLDFPLPPLDSCDPFPKDFPFGTLGDDLPGTLDTGASDTSPFADS
ncbi:putative C6 transcription factor [Aspergillus fijiensis CBS 313.89]|uniref:Putative C6 transcription factor n=1 Tax=Aspergillus fijiensis CBS 313.89 TaxID=1448319 RepID=A0A8G1RMV1_9EURO|nr:putative C6 transcription factor [Aspergillus fijiensis CBS 313.89]RAK74665.1 putative C6 transcription factor [Aspergillus fijiensis CBS 313.89]